MVWYGILKSTNLLQYQKLLISRGDRSFQFESLLIEREININLWCCEQLMFNNDSSFKDWQPSADFVMHVYCYTLISEKNNIFTIRFFMLCQRTCVVKSCFSINTLFSVSNHGHKLQYMIYFTKTETCSF